MTQTQIRQLIMLGVAGAAIYYLFFRSSSAFVPPMVTVTPRVTALPSAQPASGPQVAGW